MRNRLPTGPLAGVVASVIAVAVVTGLIALLEPRVPILSLGVLYILAVLPIAVVWGLPYAVGVSVASMLAFNWFFLPPRHTLTMNDSRNWFALGVFVVTAVVVSELAASTRRRERESALMAEITASLLEHSDLDAELDRIAVKASGALRKGRVVIDPSTRDVRVEGGRPGDRSAQRLVDALVPLVAVAVDRERLAREALEAEALRRTDVMKTALLRAVSHDLRTPLMAISTAGSALARPDLSLNDGDRAALLETIIEESHRLSRLVDNLLDLSRLQAGAAEPQQELWEVDDLIVQALDGLGDAAVRVDVSFPEESPAVRVDAHQVQRVLANLIENALKYSPASEPVRVQVGSTPTEAHVRVIDHGPGVPADDAERIFEPFHRLPASEGRAGAGLGLAIARGFAEANGGEVHVESRFGQGATFVLSLPLEPIAVPARA